MLRSTAVLLLLFCCVPVAHCETKDALLHRAAMLTKSGHADEAKGILDTFVKGHPGGAHEPRALMMMGNILTKKGASADEAIAQFRQVADKFPDSPEAPEALLRIGYANDRVGRKAGDWDQLVKKYPRTKQAAEALHCLAHQALRNGDPETAGKLFAQSAGTADADAELANDSLAEAGYACISQYWKDPARSRVYLENAEAIFKPLAAKPGAGEQALRARMGLGELYMVQGFGKEAAEQYQAVLDAKSKDPYVASVAQFELGCALYVKGDYNAAIPALDKFIDSQAGKTLADKHKLWIAAKPGYAKVAAVDKVKAKKLTGVELVPQAVYWKAESLARLHRYAEAKRLADQLLAGFPDLTTIDRVKDLAKRCSAVLPMEVAK